MGKFLELYGTLSYSSNCDGRADARRKERKHMASLLQVTGLTKIYGKRGAATRALDGVDLSLEAGEYVGIMGASGSGKTTLLNCISTIDKPTSGSILVEGRDRKSVV